MKTTWQKIYSTLGFWSYYSYDEKGRKRIFYWCCLPYGKFFRKFDLFSYHMKEDF